MQIRVEVLGPFRLVVNGHEVTVKRRQVQRALVVLAAQDSVPLTPDQLVEHLWGGDLPSDPRASLRVALSRVRAGLGEASPLLIATPSGYWLDAVTDLGEYEQLCTQASVESDDSTAAELWSLAEQLWDDNLPCLAEELMLDATEGRLRRNRSSSLINHAECLSRLGRHSEVLELAPMVQLSDPTDERIAIVHATALASTGRRAAAIDVLSATRSSLRNDLGISPGKHFVETEDKIISEESTINIVDIVGVATDESSFVGRSAEIDTLLELAPGLCVIWGEPGAGKTSLMQKVAERLASDQPVVLRVKATQSPTRPMESLAELLAEIAERIPSDNRSDTLRSALSRLAPELVEGDVAMPASRESLLALAREAIDDYASLQPRTVVLFDDVQWMDRASAQVFRSLIEHPSVSMIATSRENVSSHLEFLSVTSSRVREVRLAPLSRDDVTELVRRDLPSLPLDQTVDRLLDQSGGNALFLTLLARIMAEGAFTESGLPPNVLLSVQQRFTALSEQTRRTLEIASIFIESFQIEVLETLTSGAAIAIDEALGQRLIAETSESGRYRFVHALVGEAAYQMLAPGRRLELHDEAGRQLEEWGAPAAEFALHCGEAAPMDPARAVDAHLRAAHDFANSFDWDTALLHANHGLGHHQNFSLEQSTGFAELLVIAGTALQAQGKSDGDELLIAGVRASLKQSHLANALAGLLSLCTRGRMTSADGQPILDLLHQAMKSSPTLPQQAQLLACESTLVSISPLQQQGRDAFASAFAMLDRVSDSEARREVLLRTHLGFPHPADFAQRVRSTQLLAEMAGNDPDLLWETAFLSFGTAMVLNDAAGAEESLLRMRHLTPRIRMRQRNYGLRFSEAAWARFNDDLDGAERLLGEALLIGQEAFGDDWTLVVYAALTSSIREAQGRLHELLPLTDGWMAEDPDWPTWHVFGAACAASAGDKARARQELDWLMRDNFACLSPDIGWPAMFSFLTGPVELLEDADAAAALLDLIEPYAGLNLWNGACVHKSADEVIEIYRRVSTRSTNQTSI